MKSEVLQKIDIFKSKYMIYADEMAYDNEELESPLAVSIPLNRCSEKDEETKSIIKSQIDDLKSSYWMPVSHDNFTTAQLDEMVRRGEIKKLDLP